MEGNLDIQDFPLSSSSKLLYVASPSLKIDSLHTDKWKIIVAFSLPSFREIQNRGCPIPQTHQDN